jgi:hypothetical protein
MRSAAVARRAFVDGPRGPGFAASLKARLLPAEPCGRLRTGRRPTIPFHPSMTDAMVELIGFSQMSFRRALDGHRWGGSQGRPALRHLLAGRGERKAACDEARKAQSSSCSRSSASLQTPATHRRRRPHGTRAFALVRYSEVYEIANRGPRQAQCATCRQAIA